MIRQCVAIKSDGEQCRRTTVGKSLYCHSHRNLKVPPVDAEWLGPSERELAAYFVQCKDCGGYTKIEDSVLHFDEMDTLCESCSRLRFQIEDRIHEFLNERPNNTANTNEIAEDLARFGIEKDVVDASVKRMMETKQLFQGRSK